MSEEGLEDSTVNSSTDVKEECMRAFELGYNLGWKAGFHDGRSPALRNAPAQRQETINEPR